MKKIIVLILIIYAIFIPSVYAHEMLSDGWQIIPAVDANKSDSWSKQKKVWALYVNGVEKKRYSLFVGVHRGWGDAPENSLASFKSVKDHGYYGFETDVRFTSDNIAVLCHDEYINNVAVNNDLTKITGNKIYVKNLTYSQLKNKYIFNIQRLNTDTNKTLSNYNSNRITTFEQMLDFVKANNMQVSIELKEGTQAQIKSLVDMVNRKNLSNNVRWISYRVNLIEYVNKADNSERVGVLIAASGNCNGNSNKYCEGDGRDKADSIYNRIKTNNNLVWFGDTYTSKYNLPRTNFGNNMPKTKSETDQKLKSYTLNTIPQGKITISNKSISMNNTNKKEISYTYNGDGTVKCKSDNAAVSCSINTSKKTITISTNSNSSLTAKLNVYATQGITHSATPDNTINVSITKEEKKEENIVKNIIVKGYNINFDKNKYNYVLKIKDENKLNITCELEDNNYKYVVEGNNNLKDGSTIYINIFKNNIKKYSYSIEIEKEEVKEERETIVSEEVEGTPVNNNIVPEEPREYTIIIDPNELTTIPEETDSTATETDARVVFERNDSEVEEPTSEEVEPTVVDVPDTENNNIIYYIIAFIVLLIGFTYIENGSKLYRHNKN